MNNTEVWLPVNGWEGLYEVSSLGGLRSVDRWVRGRNRNGRPSQVLRRGKSLRLVVNRYGYLAGNFARDGERVNFELHRIVCAAFHGAAPAGHQAAHWNGIRTDCRAANLRWATAAENSADRHRHGTDSARERNPRAKLTEADVAFIRSSSLNGERLAETFGVWRTTINRIKRGAGWLTT